LAPKTNRPLFVRPEGDGAPGATGRTVRGFNVAVARGAAMEWLAISDLNAGELAAFVVALAQGRLNSATE